MKTRLQVLLEAGQSVWLDYLRRGMTQSGELQAMIDRGLRGVTSNPTIFEHAIGGSTDYDEALKDLAASDRTDLEVFEALAVEDVRAAADLFRPVYDATHGLDGYVSYEVSPRLARDTDNTIAEARRLWAAIDRPNIMIKVPGTEEGWPAIERLLVDGINVNVTLLFSPEHYIQVAVAYLRALETRMAAGRPIDRVASVASFFVSRVDTEIDRRLQQLGGAALDLRGRAAIANAQLAYATFQDLVRRPRWRRLAANGARPQRLLWASTAVKDPAYPDLMYVEQLIGPDTVSTIPPGTLAQFEDHGTVRPTLTGDGEAASRQLERVQQAGVNLEDVVHVLEEAGVRKFAQSFDSLLSVIGQRRDALVQRAPPRASAELRALDLKVAQRLDQLEARRLVRRIWSRDPTVWARDPDTPEIRDRLGWLTVGEVMSSQADVLMSFANGVRHFDRVVLCGMGGSSLAPEVLWRTFGRAAGFPSLLVLDSTDPRSVASVEREGSLDRTLFIIASKSGTTQESDSFFRYFWERTGQRGEQFVAITDPGTPLVHVANECRFRKGFANPPDIGGRYSALSYFGLVPAALIGIDVARLLHRAHRMCEACDRFIPPFQNPAAWLGAILAEAALGGRDKLTFVLSPSISSLGLWVEQLVAESTGKNGRGILPVAGEALGPPEVYGHDRVFAYLALQDEASHDIDHALDALSAAGHPVVRLTLDDKYDLGQEFFRWEFATAVAGSILGIHPFDQPNVAESKANTRAVLQGSRSPSPAAGPGDITRFLAGIGPGDYLALLAYLPYAAENDRRLAAFRHALRDRLKVATTVGYGPRYLHSTGQFHKGGPPVGHFLQITDSSGSDLPIPGEPFTFGALEAAQAEGDLESLRKRGRPAIRVEGLDVLEGAL